jgi:hypothetical protein
MTTDFVLDALEQALYARRPGDSDDNALAETINGLYLFPLPVFWLIGIAALVVLCVFIASLGSRGKKSL